MRSSIERANTMPPTQHYVPSGGQFIEVAQGAARIAPGSSAMAELSFLRMSLPL
jgi:hypothetical protein